MNEKEELLSGGNVSNVFRSGNTVRRDLKADSARIHRVLLHLERKGFSCAPRFLGIDDKNREILSFIEGESGNYPLKKYMWSDEVLRKIAIMMRCYHDAVSDFPIDQNWVPIDNTPQPFEVLCHNDFAIYNIIFHQGQPVGIIDFDMAAPGPRIWDIAYALYTCVPLSRLHHRETGETVDYEPSRDASRTKQRVRLFLEAYGMEGKEEEVIEAVWLRVEALCKTMHRKAKEGDQAFQKMIDDGHDAHYKKDLEFIRKHGHEWM